MTSSIQSWNARRTSLVLSFRCKEAEGKNCLHLVFALPGKLQSPRTARETALGTWDEITPKATAASLAAKGTSEGQHSGSLRHALPPVLRPVSRTTSRW